MKEIFIDGEYEYDYEELDGVYTLYHNHSEQWNLHTKGGVALQIIDDGNGLKFGGKKIKNRIDYSQSIYLTILLKLINKDYKFEVSNKVIF